MHSLAIPNMFTVPKHTWQLLRPASSEFTWLDINILEQRAKDTQLILGTLCIVYLYIMQIS